MWYSVIYSLYRTCAVINVEGISEELNGTRCICSHGQQSSSASLVASCMLQLHGSLPMFCKSTTPWMRALYTASVAPGVSLLCPYLRTSPSSLRSMVKRLLRLDMVHPNPLNPLRAHPCCERLPALATRTYGSATSCKAAPSSTHFERCGL